MNQVACQECSRGIPTSEAYELNGKIYCGTCAQAACQRAQDAGQPVALTRYVDQTVCARCHTYIGAGGGVPFGSAQFCMPCSELVQNWPYPQWLKFGMAALLLLLAIALIHGRKYFQAGSNLYRGEQLVEKGQYEQALPYLKATVKLAPNSDKGALLTAKAALLSGEPETAQQALNAHDNGHFDDSSNPDFQEVKKLWDNAIKAIGELQQAAKLDLQDGHEAEAASLARDAVTIYPQLPQRELIIDHYDAGMAFANKDYDTFLALAEKDWNLSPSGQTAGMLSSALACKYAVTGEAPYRQRSLEMLAKAKEFLKGDKQSLDALAEFEERNNYRLQTRQIISKSEFDRKFRQASGGATN